MAEEEGYLALSGERITLQRLHHSASCREFQVRCPRLQLRSLSAVTCSVWLVAYGLFVLSQVRKRLWPPFAYGLRHVPVAQGRGLLKVPLEGCPQVLHQPLHPATLPLPSFPTPVYGSEFH